MPLFDGPVYGTALTLALVQPKLDEHGIDAGDRLKPSSPRASGHRRPVHDRVHPRHAQHARLRGAGHHHAGRHDRHTGDFKIDQTPIDGSTSTCTASPSSAQGVLALFADSTNVDRQGFTGPETDVIEAFEELFTSTHGKLVVATFSSSIYRMQVLVDLAAQFERKVAFVGRSMSRTRRSRSGSATCGFRRACRFATATSRTTPSQDVLCITTGSQGEPQAALSRIAIDDHRIVKLGPTTRWSSRRARFPATRRRSPAR